MSRKISCRNIAVFKDTYNDFISSLDEKVYFEIGDGQLHSVVPLLIILSACSQSKDSKRFLLFDGNEIDISRAKFSVKQKDDRVHLLMIYDVIEKNGHQLIEFLCQHVRL